MLVDAKITKETAEQVRWLCMMLHWAPSEVLACAVKGLYDRTSPDGALDFDDGEFDEEDW